jgi:hypothetical protein
VRDSVGPDQLHDKHDDEHRDREQKPAAAAFEIEQAIRLPADPFVGCQAIAQAFLGGCASGGTVAPQVPGLGTEVNALAIRLT